MGQMICVLLSKLVGTEVAMKNTTKVRFFKCTTLSSLYNIKSQKKLINLI